MILADFLLPIAFIKPFDYQPRFMHVSALFCFSSIVTSKQIFQHFFSESCSGKAMLAYTEPQRRKKEESEGLRGERDQIKFIDL